MKAADGEPDRRQHPLDLVLPALVDRKLDRRGFQGPDPRGCGAAVLELDALGEPPERFVVRATLHLRLVDLLDLVPWMSEPVCERAVVREEQRARRVRVEPADGNDAGREVDEVDYGRPPVGVARRRDDAGRLVQDHVRERLRLERPPVELDPVAMRDEGIERAGLAVHAHAPGLDQLVGAAPRGDAGTREVGIQAHGRHYSCVVGYAFGHIDELGDGYGFRKVRAPLGVTAFGVNVIVMPPGYEGFRHYHDTQDELYFVHSGRALVEADGEERELGAGGLCHVESTTPRKVSNASDEEDLVLLVVGGKDGYVARDGHLVDPERDLERRAAFGRGG